jgi:hypothetical protein
MPETKPTPQAARRWALSKKVVGNPGLCFTAEGAWIGSAHTTCY